LIRDKEYLLGLSEMREIFQSLEDRVLHFAIDKGSEWGRLRLHPQTAGLPLQDFYLLNFDNIDMLRNGVDQFLIILEEQEILERFKNLRL
ncbi:MAG: hypothetical protein FWC98_04580, partial [Bacteroidales bacterium]|nr:hypothetical protein [Bacteroidales bacterium]